jgi:hypothetical protein
MHPQIEVHIPRRSGPGASVIVAKDVQQVDCRTVTELAKLAKIHATPQLLPHLFKNETEMKFLEILERSGVNSIHIKNAKTAISKYITDFKKTTKAEIVAELNAANMMMHAGQALMKRQDADEDEDMTTQQVKEMMDCARYFAEKNGTKLATPARAISDLISTSLGLGRLPDSVLAMVIHTAEFTLQEEEAIRTMLKEMKKLQDATKAITGNHLKAQAPVLQSGVLGPKLQPTTRVCDTEQTASARPKEKPAHPATSTRVGREGAGGRGEEGSRVGGRREEEGRGAGGRTEEGRTGIRRIPGTTQTAAEAGTPTPTGTTATATARSESGERSVQDLDDGAMARQAMEDGGDGEPPGVAQHLLLQGVGSPRSERGDAGRREHSAEMAGETAHQPGGSEQEDLWGSDSSDDGVIPFGAITYGARIDEREEDDRWSAIYQREILAGANAQHEISHVAGSGGSELEIARSTATIQESDSSPSPRRGGDATDCNQDEGAYDAGHLRGSARDGSARGTTAKRSTIRGIRTKTQEQSKISKFFTADARDIRSDVETHAEPADGQGTTGTVGVGHGDEAHEDQTTETGEGKHLGGTRRSRVSSHLQRLLHDGQAEQRQAATASQFERIGRELSCQDKVAQTRRSAGLERNDQAGGSIHSVGSEGRVPPDIGSPQFQEDVEGQNLHGGF